MKLTVMSLSFIGLGLIVAFLGCFSWYMDAPILGMWLTGSSAGSLFIARWLSKLSSQYERAPYPTYTTNIEV